MENTKNNPIDISVVIVNWNTRRLLRNCIVSIYENVKGLKYEIIVIDNGSSDNSADMVKKTFAGVKLIVNNENRGFASANNQGILAAQGRYVLLLNSDTVVLPDCLEKAVDFADSHSSAAVVGCKVLNHDRSLQPSCFMFPSVFNMVLSSSYLYKLLPRNSFFSREAMGQWNREDIREVDVVTGCFMLVRAEAIKQVGLMDERFFMYAEEADWCYRFKQAGWSIMFTPDCEIIHLGGQSSGKIQSEMLIQLRLSILKFIDKHHGRLKYKLACFLTIVFFMVRLPVWSVLSILTTVPVREQATIRTRAYINGIIKILNGYER